MIVTRSNILIALAAAAGILVVRNTWVMLNILPDEVEQGAIYRILFFHVPAAWTSLIACFVALGFGLAYLKTGKLVYDSISAATVETGLVFGLTNIFTGMIWATIIWGTSWTWDARLTSMFLLQLLFAGYLMLRQAIPDASTRARSAAFMTIFASADVPIIWFSIKWWRTQHPAPVFWDKGSIDEAMRNMTYINLVPMLLIAVVVIAIRARQIDLRRELDQLRRAAFSY